jgi:hypothetical protein
LNIYFIFYSKAPRPPSGKSRGPAPAFRTSMFKKDFEQKPGLRKAAEKKKPVPLRANQ